MYIEKDGNICCYEWKWNLCIYQRD